LIPVAGELSSIAPVIAQVKRETVQLSEIAGLVTETVCSQTEGSTFTDTLAGQVTTGCTVSVTVTVNVHVVLLLLASRTVYVTVVTPTLKVYVPTLLIPVDGEEAVVAPVITQVKRVTAQLSAVVGFDVETLAEQPAPEALAVTFDGQAMVGLMLSVTTTLNEHVVILPAASSTV
jgi:hypothetical protein